MKTIQKEAFSEINQWKLFKTMHSQKLTNQNYSKQSIRILSHRMSEIQYQNVGTEERDKWEKNQEI